MCHALQGPLGHAAGTLWVAAAGASALRMCIWSPEAAPGARAAVVFHKGLIAAMSQPPVFPLCVEQHGKASAR